MTRDILIAASGSHDYITTGGLVLIALITAVGGLLTALIERGRRESKRGTATAVGAANDAKEAAEHAAVMAQPTSNGFVESVTQALERIEATQHAQAQDIGGIRQEIRAERVERITLARAVSNFIERHDT